MLSPADVRPAVEAVLRAADRGLSTYEILDRLPDSLLQQVVAERGVPGSGSGNSYSAASLISDAVEGLLPSLEPPYRVYVHGQAVFTVAGQEVRPGNSAIAFYRLSPPPVTNPTPPVMAVASAGIGTAPSVPNLLPSPTKPEWFEKPSLLVFWFVLFWPLFLVGMHYNGKAAIAKGRTPWYEESAWLVLSAIFFFPLFFVGLFNSRKIQPRWKWAIAGTFVLLYGTFVVTYQPNGAGNDAAEDGRENGAVSLPLSTPAPRRPAASQPQGKRPGQPQKSFLVAISAPGKKVLVKGTLPFSGDEEVLVTVTEKSSGSNLSAFRGQDKPTLREGTFSSGPFGGDRGLNPGYYTVEARYGNNAMTRAFQLRKDGSVVQNSTAPSDDGYGVEFLSYLAGPDEYNPEMVRKLLRKHPQLVNSKTSTGETPLILLAGGRPGDTDKVGAQRLSIAKALVQGGAQVDERDSDSLGRTALCLAASMDDYQLVKYLLEEGANPNKMGRDMIPPYDLAGDNSRIKSILKHWGGMSYDEMLRRWDGKDPARRQQFLRSLSEGN